MLSPLHPLADLMNLKNLSCGLVLAAGGCLLANAQISPCSHITVLANLSPRSGQTADTLPLPAPESFRVHIGDADVKVVSATPMHPRRYVIVLDMSGSMANSAEKYAIANIAAGDFIDSLPSNSQVGMVLFSRTSEIIPLTSNKQDLANILVTVRSDIKHIKYGHGRTAINDALMAAVRMLGTPNLGDTLYLISDGDLDESKSSPEELKHMLVANQIRLFAALVESEFDQRTPGEAGYSEFPLDELTTLTGGAILSLDARLPSNDGLNRTALHKLGDESRRFYPLMESLIRLDLDPSLTLHRDRNVRIELQDKGDRTRSIWDLHYPTKIAPCAAE